MNTVGHFRHAMAERRKWRKQRDQLEWEIWTRTARKLLLIIHGVPSNQWKEYGL